MERCYQNAIGKRATIQPLILNDLINEYLILTCECNM